MMKKMLKLLAPVVVGAAMLLSPRPAQAYVEAPMSLGSIIQQSSNVLLMKVEKVDREKNLIIFRKVKDIKGVHPTDIIKHNIAHAGFNPREWQYVMEGAQVGNLAVMFHNGAASETFLPGYWYQTYAGDWWAMSHGEPFLLRSYAGKPEKLAAAVASIIAGQEVVIPCMVDDKTLLHTRAAKIQRVKASMKIQDYNPKRDFVGWGNEDFRVIQGMPAFTMYTAVSRTDPEAGGISPIDFDGDGKMDFCIYGAGKVSLMKNAGSSFDEASLPYVKGSTVVATDEEGDPLYEDVGPTPRFLALSRRHLQDLSAAAGKQKH